MIKLFQQQTAATRIILKFLFNVVFYFIIRVLLNLVWEDESSIFSARVAISSILFGIIFTLLFDWKLVKKVFSKHADNEPKH